MIHGIDPEISHVEFVVFVRPSGCGGSTALHRDPAGGQAVLNAQCSVMG